MTFEEFLIASIAILSGVVISIGFFVMVYKLIKLFVDRKSAKRLPEDLQNRLKELEQTNQYLEKRIRNLEAIVTEDDFKIQKTQNVPVSEASKHSSSGSGNKKLVNTLRSDE